MNECAGRVLLVEDEVKLAELVRDYLLAAGFEVELLHEGRGVVERLRRGGLDLLLLDLMLPGRDGLSICREVRSLSALPIIMMTARVEEVDRLLGLELGADDYICKPFSPREVVARVKAVLRRSRTVPEAAAARVRVDLERYEAWIDGEKLDLTPVELRLLATLHDNGGKVFSRDQLLDHVYDDHRVISDRTVDSHVKNLRRKLAERLGDEVPIRSVYGVGYRWEW